MRHADRSTSRGRGASSRVSSASGTVKWRMLMSMVPAMQTAVKITSDTHIARQWVASSAGTTGCAARDFRRRQRESASVNASRPRNPGEDFKTSSTGK